MWKLNLKHKDEKHRLDNKCIGGEIVPEEKETFKISTKKSDKEISKAIQEAEELLNDKSVKAKATITKEPSTKLLPGVVVFLVAVGTAFATKFAEKMGESLADWLTKKLGVESK
jgi:hypothetical protein